MDDYAYVVLKLLSQRKYPVLQDHVVLDIYYKMILADHDDDDDGGGEIVRYDWTRNNPEDVYFREAKPFVLHYLSSYGGRTFYLHRARELAPGSERCVSVKLYRSVVDDFVLHRPSASFEEEIYHLLTLLNFDVPRLSSIINFGFVDSTRFLPQRVKLWVSKYAERDIDRGPVPRAERERFGPVTERIPIRVVAGRLSECTSRSILLSLNNHFDSPHLSYLYHYSEKWKALLPLAFNPLENPIV